MTAFDTMVGTLFADPNLGTPALWRAGGLGAGVALRLLWRSPDEVIISGERRFVATGRTAEIRIADAPGLTVGDTIEIAGDILPVIAAPESDADRLVWLVTLGDPEP